MAKTRISRPEFVGSTVYVVVWNDSDQAYNGSTFVTYTTTQDTFDQGAATVPANGIVSYTLPAGAAYWKWFVQSGGTADFDDQDIAYGDHEQEVTGDIGGKVLGGGSGTIAGTGARADLPDAPNPTAVEAIQAGLGTEAKQDTLLGRLTAARAGYMDNLNAGSVLATQADVQAINATTSRHLLLLSLQQYERPESGSTDFTIEARTYDVDGAAVDADSTPTLTVTGNVTGDLSANLSAASNPATGVYRWTYTVENDATLEQLLYGVSATIDSDTFTLSLLSQVCDFVAATFTTADRQDLQDAKDAAESVDTKLGEPANATFALDFASMSNTMVTVANRLGAWSGSGLNTLLGAMRAFFRKDADAAVPDDINTDLGSGVGTADNTTDSNEAIRDRGDAAWTTGSGGGGGGGATRPVNQTPVPIARTWQLVPTDDSGLVGKLPLSATLADVDKLWALDFRSDLATNGRLLSIDAIELVSGDVDGISWGADLGDVDDFGVDRSVAKLKLTPLLAGTYVFAVTVSYDDADGGGTSYGEVTWFVS
jgi:hypothetical protein